MKLLFVLVNLFALGVLGDPGVNRQKDPFTVTSHPEEFYFTPSDHPNEVNPQGFTPISQIPPHENLVKPNEPTTPLQQPGNIQIQPGKTQIPPEKTEVAPSFWTSLLNTEYFNRIAVIFLGFAILIVLSIFKSIFLAWSIVKRSTPDEVKNPIEDLTKYVYTSIQKFQDDLKTGDFKLPQLPVIFPVPTAASEIPNSIAQYLLNNSIVTYLNNLLPNIQKPVL